MKWVSICISFLVISCGGSGSNVTPQVVLPPAAQRSDLMCGYYYGSKQTIDETKDHCNIQWIPPYPNAVELIEYSAPSKVIVMVPDMFVGCVFNPNTIQWARNILTTVSKPTRIVAFYPFDEFNTQACVSESELEFGLTQIRNMIGTEFAMHIPWMAMIYAGNGNYPGIKLFEIVGIDNYDLGIRVLDLVLPLDVTQHKMLVIGGANPWRTDPQPFLDYANRNPQVLMLTFFICDNVTAPGVGLGICHNGMLPLFKSVGQHILTGV